MCRFRISNNLKQQAPFNFCIFFFFFCWLIAVCLFVLLLYLASFFPFPFFSSHCLCCHIVVSASSQHAASRRAKRSCRLSLSLTKTVVYEETAGFLCPQFFPFSFLRRFILYLWSCMGSKLCQSPLRLVRALAFECSQVRRDFS